MNLHHPRVHADWHYVKPGKRNVWQRAASATYGVATPANAVSLLGAGLVATGLFEVYAGHVLAGSLLIIIGRLADIVDGFLADKTGTKSTLGEAIDASLDKLAILGVLTVFIATDTIPLLPAVLILIQNAANIALSILARGRRTPLHSTKIGKLSTAGMWAAICIYGLAAATSFSPLSMLAHLLAASSLLLGFYATAEYARTLISPIVKE